MKIFGVKSAPEKPVKVGGTVKQAQPIRKAPVKPRLLKALEESSVEEGGGGPIVEPVEPLQPTETHATQIAVGGESEVSTSQPLAPPSGDTVAQPLAPGVLSPLERVFTASDGRRYRAVLESERYSNLFDSVCVEGASTITVRLGEKVIKCRRRNLTTRFIVKASSLEALG